MINRKAISPILATVIIIAVTLVIAIGVIGWIMGIWGTFGSTEMLQVYPDSYINATLDNTTKPYVYHVKLHIKNSGTATAVFSKIEVVGLGTFTPNVTKIDPGETSWIDATNTTTVTVTAGATYQVKIYTAAGNVYSAVISTKS